jgi:hypothetical protein
MVTHSEPEAWSEDELILMGQLCSVGVPLDHVAKFLGREVRLVKVKATGLRLATKACGQLQITASPPISPEFTIAPTSLAAPPGSSDSSS